MQEEPLLLARLATGSALPLAVLPANEDQPPAQLLPVQLRLQLPAPDGVPRVTVGMRLPRATVPDDDVAAAVLPGADDTLEVRVLDGVVLDVDREPPGCGVEGGPLGTAQLTSTPSISNRRS